MKRTYLEEDIRLIQKYFPGARAVTVRTPFDLSSRPARTSYISPDTFHDTDNGSPYGAGGMLWSH